jgi:DNA ligase-1
VRFAEVVTATQAVSATRARSRKVAALADLLRRLDPEEVPVVTAVLTGAPRQGRIGIGWRTVAGLQVEPAAEPTLEILDVDAALDALEALRGPGSQAARAETLEDLWRRATPDEQDLLGRLLVGELRHGALEGLVTDAIAKAADVPLPTVRRAAMLAGDLGRVAIVALTEGAAGLDAIGLTLLQPIQPMLAQTSGDVTEALSVTAGADTDTPERGLASVEWKLDGARIQVHRVGDDVRIYTRNLNDVTDRLPGIAALVRGFPAERLVLDGEAVGIGDGEEPDLFQNTMSRFSRHAKPALDAAAGETDTTAMDTDQTGPPETAEAVVDTAGGGDERGVAVASADVDAGIEAALAPIHGLEARFFDVLHVDGEDLIDRPLSERLTALDRVAGPWRIRGELTDDPAAAQRVLDEALAAGHEGVMVKAASSRYEAGRRGGAWRKVKPVHTLDLVVLAVEWGSGRRRGWLSNIHLGARDEAGGFVMVGKTFKGMTDELLRWQTERFLELEVGREGHIVHVRPEQVVEIALDGVQVSTRYAGGVALRFARVRRYRFDKSPAEADTIDTVRSLLPSTRSAG